jgi:hypothetical protein
MASLKENLQTAIAYKPLQYLLIGGAVLGLIFWFARSQGKESGKKVETKYPDGTDQARAEWQRTIGTALVSTVFAVLSGVSVQAGPKVDAMNQLMALTDQQLAWVAGEYARRYAKTLQKEIEDETFWGITGDDIHTSVLNRLRNLSAVKFIATI